MFTANDKINRIHVYDSEELKFKKHTRFHVKTNFDHRTHVSKELGTVFTYAFFGVANFGDLSQ